MRTITYGTYKKLGINTKGTYNKDTKTITIDGCDKLIDCVTDLVNVLTEETIEGIGTREIYADTDKVHAAMLWYGQAKDGNIDFNIATDCLNDNYKAVLETLKKHFN